MSRWLAPVLLLYAALVAWLTWPLAAHLTTHLPNTFGAARFDSLLIAWTLAWQSHALVTAPSTFADGNAFHPAHLSIFFGEAGLGALPFFLPTFLLTGNPALALNLVFLGGLVLTATGVHLVVARWTASHTAALAAGVALLANRWLLWTGVPPAPSYAILLYLPAIALLATELPERPRAGWLLVLVVLQCLTSVYVAAAVLGTLGLLGLARLIRRVTRASGGRLLGVVALAVPAVLLLFAGYLRVRALEPGLDTQTHWRFGPFPALLPWNFLTPVAPTSVAVPALLLIALGVVLRLRERPPAGAGAGDGGRWWSVVFWVAAGLLLATPPYGVWHEKPVVLPPAVLVGWTPVYAVLRVPSRLAVGALVGIALLVGLGLAACERALARTRLTRALLCAASCGAIYAGYAHGFAVPRGLAAYVQPLPPAYPLQPVIAPDSPMITLLRRGAGPLLELPVPLAPAGHPAHQPQAEAMYRSIFHWRPILNGYSGYWPRGFPERMALARALPDPTALETLRGETGLTQILVHLAALPSAERDRWNTLAGQSDAAFRLAGRDGDDVLFDVK